MENVSFSMERVQTRLAKIGNKKSPLSGLLTSLKMERETRLELATSSLASLVNAEKLLFLQLF